MNDAEEVTGQTVTPPWAGFGEPSASTPWMLTAALIVLMAISALLHAIASWIALRAFGVPVIAIGIFGGPTLLRRTIGNVDCRLHLVPPGSYVRGDEQAFLRLAVGKRVVVQLAGCLALLIAGLLSTRGQPPLGHVISIIWHGTIDPLHSGAETLRRFAQMLAMTPFEAAGAFILAFALFNLIPLPITGVGQAILEWAEGLSGPLPRLRTLLLVLSIPVLVAILASWTIAYLSM